MPILADYIKLALEVSKETKRLMTSAHDIIPKSELPMISRAMMDKFSAKYGARAVEYLNYTFNSMRTVVRDPKYFSTLKEYTAMVTSLALSRLGMGECEEHAYVAAHELLKRGYHDIHICLLKGKTPTDGLPGSECVERGSFFHVVIIMNALGQLNDITSFSQLDDLPDEVIILDPYLKHVGLANWYREDMHGYLRHYSITGMSILRTYSRKDVENIKTIEGKVSAHLRRFDLAAYTPGVPVDKEIRAIVVHPVKIFDIAYSMSYAGSFFNDKLRAVRNITSSDTFLDSYALEPASASYKHSLLLDLDDESSASMVKLILDSETCDSDFPKYASPSLRRGA